MAEISRIAFRKREGKQTLRPSARHGSWPEPTLSGRGSRRQSEPFMQASVAGTDMLALV
jgi:hypothetical protein